LDLSSFLLYGGVLTLGALAQTAAGFGYGLFCVPLFVWLDMPLADAIPFTLGGVTLQTAYNCYKERDSVPWRLAFRIVTMRLLAMPLGVFLLTLLAASSVTTTRSVIGALLLTLITVRTLVRPTPKPELSRAWEVFAALMSGLLAAMVGMGGPPLIVYALAHDWVPAKIRRFLWSQFLLGGPLIVALLTVRFGSAPALAYGLGLVSVPFVWFGSELGERIGKNWSRLLLDRIAVAALALMGLGSLLSPWL
jgi:uncharacterized membrane protein YfcA